MIGKRHYTKVFLGIALYSLFLTPLAMAKQINVRTIQVNDMPRQYRIVTPDIMTGLLPLIFAFHGHNDSMFLMPAYSGLDELVDHCNCILVYPNGLPTGSLGGYTWQVYYGDDATNPDLHFFEALYNELTATYPISLAHVYLTGMSIGAFWSTVVGANHAALIAAIAPHSGGLGLYEQQPINAVRKYAVLVMHGRVDRVIPVFKGRSLRDQYIAEGHATTYLEFPTLGHAWLPEEMPAINQTIYEFFMAHAQQ